MNPCENNSGRPWLDLTDSQLIRQCNVDVYRASGPGGQKRNKTSSAVRLRHPETGLIVTATESRSQHENRARAVRRLRRAIALHVRRAVEWPGYRPGECMASCISHDGRLCAGRRDHRYDHVVAEIQDLLAACDMQMASAAAGLGVSTSNLVAFLRNDPTLWQLVNRLRLAAGHRTLR